MNFKILQDRKDIKIDSILFYRRNKVFSMLRIYITYSSTIKEDLYCVVT